MRCIQRTRQPHSPCSGGHGRAFCGLRVKPPGLVEASQKLGLGVDVIRPLGLVLLVSTLLHVVPRTQLLGAVLVTAYLGGATATHVLTGTPFWFPVVMGLVLWIAYGLRSPQLRTFVISARQESNMDAS